MTDMVEAMAEAGEAALNEWLKVRDQADNGKDGWKAAMTAALSVVLDRLREPDHSMVIAMQFALPAMDDRGNEASEVEAMSALSALADRLAKDAGI